MILSASIFGVLMMLVYLLLFAAYRRGRSVGGVLVYRSVTLSPVFALLAVVVVGALRTRKASLELREFVAQGASNDKGG